MEAGDDGSPLSDEFVLSTTFTAGETGVRAAGLLETGGTAPGERRTLVLGDQLGGMAAFDWSSRETALLEPHGHAVTALVALGDDLYATGCKDGVVRVFNGRHERVRELAGHGKPVTSLAWVRPGAAAAEDAGGNHHHHQSTKPYLVSGSWDGTARIWNLDNYSLVATLPDHENSVCVAGLRSETDAVIRVATGSAGVAQGGTIGNHAIRIWSVDLRTGTVRVDRHINQDHDGPVRGLCSFADDADAPLLASCSNDGTVKVRDGTTGQPLSTLSFAHPDQQQHPPMLLSVACLSAPNETILASSGEDGTVVIFNLTQPRSQPQTLLHASCVWNVIALPDGDLGTCCQDGRFYAFTRSPRRMADAASRAAWEESARDAHRKLRSGPSSDDVAKLPRWHESATIRGRSEGQVQLFQRDGVAIAAQWSAASRTWIEVGQVVGQGPAGNQDQGTLDGVRYDHLLPIQVDTATSGTVNLQIGYNTGENPFVAAQRFIDAHVLPQHHLAEIADYITQRVGSAAAHTLGGGGSGGGGRTVPVATTGVPMAFYSYIPSKTYKSFDLSEKTAPTTLEKIKSKIDSFQLLSPEQLAVLTGLLETLGAINRYHATKISDPELDLIAGMLRSFGPSRCFPALDVARMTVLHPDAASAARSAYWSEVARTVAALHARPQGDEGASLDATSQVAVPMLSLRLLSNAFKGGPGSLVAVSSRLEDLVVPLLQAHVSSSNKNVRLSAATLLHNVCHYVQSTAVPASLVSAVLALCREVLTNRSYEGEAIFRTLVAIGTLVMSDSNGSGAREAAASLYLASQVELAASPHGPSVKMAAKEVHSVLA